MVYAFTEQQKEAIKDYGYSVIEIKRLIYKSRERFERLWNSVKHFLDAIIEFIKKVANTAVDVLSKLHDALSKELSSIQDYKYPPSQRFKMVMVLNTNMFIDREFLWVYAKRKEHLARSDC